MPLQSLMNFHFIIVYKSIKFKNYGTYQLFLLNLQYLSLKSLNSNISHLFSSIAKFQL